MNFNTRDIVEFLSTLSLRRATPSTTRRLTNMMISIHALLAESDRLWTILYSCPGNFYPRSPCGERRQIKQTCREKLVISIHALLAESDSKSDTATAFPLSFLSTLSLRRATARRASRQQPAGISIHALLAESDRNGLAIR